MTIVERDIDGPKVFAVMDQLFALGLDKDWSPPDAAVGMLAVACIVIADLRLQHDWPEFWKRLQRVSNYIVAEFAEGPERPQ